MSNNDSISSSLNHLYDNTWGSSCFDRFHLADCFRHHLWCNLNCRSFYWGFFTHTCSIPWKFNIQKFLIMRLPGFFSLSSTVKVSFPSSFLTYFSPTTLTLSCFNFLSILKMQFLSLLLLMLANCSVCASLLAKYTAVLAAYLTFRYSSLVLPFFHCFHAFHFSFTALSTSLFHHWISLCHGQPPCVHPHISFAASRSPFSIYSQALSNYAGICWYFIDTACSNSFCTPVSFNFQVFLLGAIQMGLTGFADTTKSQTSNLCCVMHSSILITFVSLMFSVVLS